MIRNDSDFQFDDLDLHPRVGRLPEEICPECGEEKEEEEELCEGCQEEFAELEGDDDD